MSGKFPIGERAVWGYSRRRDGAQICQYSSPQWLRGRFPGFLQPASPQLLKPLLPVSNANPSTYFKPALDYQWELWKCCINDCKPFLFQEQREGKTIYMLR